MLFSTGTIQVFDLKATNKFYESPESPGDLKFLLFSFINQKKVNPESFSNMDNDKVFQFLRLHQMARTLTARHMCLYLINYSSVYNIHYRL